MLTLIVMAAVVLLLIAALGMPYGQTWYARWNG